MRRRALLTNAAFSRLFIIHGESDRVVPVRFDRESHKDLTKAGIDHVYHEIAKGRHLLDEVLAVGRGDFEKGRLMAEFFDDLESRSRSALDTEFAFTAVEAPARARCLCIEEARSFPCRVRARWESDTLDLECEGVEKLTVFFGPGRLETGVPVTVRIEGKVVYRGNPSPTLACAVENWRKFCDRKRIFIARIEIEVPEPEEEGF